MYKFLRYGNLKFAYIISTDLNPEWELRVKPSVSPCGLLSNNYLYHRRRCRGLKIDIPGIF